MGNNARGELVCKFCDSHCAVHAVSGVTGRNETYGTVSVVARVLHASNYAAISCLASLHHVMVRMEALETNRGEQVSHLRAKKLPSFTRAD